MGLFEIKCGWGVGWDVGDKLIWGWQAEENKMPSNCPGQGKGAIYLLSCQSTWGGIHMIQNYKVEDRKKHMYMHVWGWGGALYKPLPLSKYNGIVQYNICDFTAISCPS